MAKDDAGGGAGSDGSDDDPGRGGSRICDKKGPVMAKKRSAKENNPLDAVFNVRLLSMTPLDTEPSVDSNGQWAMGNGQWAMGNGRYPNSFIDAVQLHFEAPPQLHLGPGVWFGGAGVLVVVTCFRPVTSVQVPASDSSSCKEFFPHTQMHRRYKRSKLVKTTTLMTPAISEIAYFSQNHVLTSGNQKSFLGPAGQQMGASTRLHRELPHLLGNSVWLFFDKPYTGNPTAKGLMELGASAAETITSVSMTDIFFLRQRGRIMSDYTCSPSVGVDTGLIVPD
ncbi:hypothetical protein NOR_04532 [Metarhizium rileyi]|uniref:Uncharacterized protein n=1 Tax=Metarhizium rileyi (strain RCEF 4871) TaxID=1649241 RepID=A0A162HTR5_METRR|nr:hypothetical protein NOR_04532 [Metarhizium rileyi RCEF 4871]